MIRKRKQSVAEGCRSTWLEKKQSSESQQTIVHEIECLSRAGRARISTSAKAESSGESPGSERWFDIHDAKDGSRDGCEAGA